MSRSGSALVVELAARLGLERELSRGLAQLFRRRPLHDPGRVLVDLATMLIDGGDCVSDLGVLAEQPDLFGRVASQSTATRLLYALGEQERAAIRAARRGARERAWALGARPATVTLDFDAQLLECHTEKEGGGPHRKGGFGFHPLHCFLDETGEQLAGLLRPGNAGSNTAADHVAVLEQALAQLPAEVADREREPSRCRSWPAPTRPAPPMPSRVRCASSGSVSRSATTSTSASGRPRWRVPKKRWLPALDGGEQAREGAWVAELTDRVDLNGWPEGTR